MMQKRSIRDLGIVGNCIRSYQEAFGEVPTITEVANATGLSRAAVGRYMKMMKDNGDFIGDGPRGYVSPEETMQRRMKQIPILGEVSCGLRKLAVQDLKGYLALPKEYLGPGEYYVLIADGESMKNIGIHTGDLVLVREQNFADPGQVVVALDENGNATLKRYRPYLTQGYVDLVPENDEMETQRIDIRQEGALVIQGVAMKVIRDIE